MPMLKVLFDNSEAITVPPTYEGITKFGDYFEDYMILGIEEIDKTDLWTDPHFGDLITYVDANSIDSSKVDYNTADEINSKHGAAFIIPLVPAGNKLDFIIKFKNRFESNLYYSK